MQRRWVIFWVLGGSYFFVMFHRFCTAVMATDLSNDLGLAPASLGFLSSMYLLGYASVQIPVGVMADWWGSRKTISLFLLIASLGAFAFGRAESYQAAVVARWLVGAGVGCVYVPALRVLGCWFGRDNFAFVTGMLLAVGNFGALSSTWPLAVVKGIWGWRTTMEVVSLITLALVVLLWLLVEDAPPKPGADETVAAAAEIKEVKEIKKSDKEASEKTDKETNKEAGNPAEKDPLGLRLMLRSRRFWALAFYFFAYEATIISFQGLWAGPFLKRVYGLSDTDIGYSLTWLALGLMFGAMVSGAMAGSALRRRHAVLVAGMLGYLLFWVPVVFATEALVLYLSPLLACMGFFGGFFSISFGIAKECFSANMAGTALGVYNFVGFVGGGLGMWAMGLIISFVSPTGANDMIAFRAAFGLTFALMLGGWIVLYMLPRIFPAPRASR